jgi:hypothetical protein
VLLADSKQATVGSKIEFNGIGGLRNDIRIVSSPALFKSRKLRPQLPQSWGRFFGAKKDPPVRAGQKRKRRGVNLRLRSGGVSVGNVPLPVSSEIDALGALQRRYAAHLIAIRIAPKLPAYCTGPSRLGGAGPWPVSIF